MCFRVCVRQRTNTNYGTVDPDLGRPDLMTHFLKSRHVVRGIQCIQGTRLTQRCGPLHPGTMRRNLPPDLLPLLRRRLNTFFRLFLPHHQRTQDWYSAKNAVNSGLQPSSRVSVAMQERAPLDFEGLQASTTHSFRANHISPSSADTGPLHSKWHGVA